MMERKAETKTVKAALTKAGFAYVRVSHGTGTAWGWLMINLGPGDEYGSHVLRSGGTWLDLDCRSDCPRCAGMRDAYARAMLIAMDVTGRHGEYHGEINICQQED